MIKPLHKIPNQQRFESEEPDEKVYYILRRHIITNIGWILGVIIMILAPFIVVILIGDNEPQIVKMLPLNYQMMMVVFWYSFTIFIAFENFLLWYFNVYIITDKRVIDIDFVGLWRKRISEASLDQVEDASYETTNFIEILFNYGNIVMQTAAEEREFDFKGVPKPDEVHDVLTNLVQQYKSKHHG